MWSQTTKYLFVLIVLIKLSSGQENAEFKIAPALLQCYSDPYLLNTDNLLPHTIETLINLIRKIEQSPGLNQGITQLSVSLIHRFRQDGIVRFTGASDSGLTIPYSASGYQIAKHSVLLKKLLPGNANNFPNDTLTDVEQCSLHSMLSSSIDTTRRGDEAQRCNQLANYRAMRVPRSLSHGSETKSKLNHFDDFEFIDKSKQGKRKREEFGKMQMSQGIDIDKDYGDVYDDGMVEPKEHVDFGTVSNADKSECPVENGVVQTPWGTVSPGNVINGIATGIQNQRVPLNILMNARKRIGQQNSQIVDNRYSSTLVGDLAEVVLRQIARDPREESINIGASGAWNSSTLPKWYFLSQRDKLEMTDAEIRGDIDGLIIALKIKEWQSKVSNLKLSQVLEMYYSQKGVLDSGIRACDRKKFFNEMIKPDELKKQTTAYSKILLEVLKTVTIKEEGFSLFADKAVNKLLKYIPQSLNDLSCESTAPNPNVIDTEIATDLIVFIDTTWTYKEIYSIIGYVSLKINLDGKTSTITLFDANEAKPLSNTTSDLGSALRTWTEDEHKKRSPGLNLAKVLAQLQNITGEIMNDEKKNSSVGGRSLISLIVPSTASLNEGESNYAGDKIKRLQEDVPDIRILFFAQGSVNRFERFVDDKQKDLIPAQSTSDGAVAATPIIERIKELSRRIINHRCGANWEGGDTGVSSMTQCITPGKAKYYRLMPNYFYSESGNRKLRIQTQQSLTTINICVSRSKENPRSNSSINQPDDLNCEGVITKAFELELNNPCNGAYEIHNCNPYYLSISAVDDNGTGSALPDSECKNPTDIPIKITAEHLTCHSGVENFIFKSSFLLIISSYFFALWFRF